MASGRRRRPDRIARSGLLSAAVAQREGERLGEVFGRAGFQLDGLGHRRMIAPTREQIMNTMRMKSPALRGASAGLMRGTLEVNGIPVRAVLSIASSGLTSWKLPTLPSADPQ